MFANVALNHIMEKVPSPYPWCVRCDRAFL